MISLHSRALVAVVPPPLSFVSLAIGFFLLCGLFPLAGKEVKPQTMLKVVTSGGIVVDGKLDEKLYADAAWNAYPAGKGETGQTRFCLHTDGTHLYLSAAITTLDGGVIAKTVQRDGAISRDDSLEWFIQCGADLSEGYQFLVNALGTVADYHLVQGGLLGGSDYHADVVAATQRTRSGWQVEIAVPLAQLELDAARESWGLQVATNHARRDPEKAIAFQTWSPVRHSLRELSTFGVLQLPGEVDFSRFAWKIRPETTLIVRREANHYLQSRIEVVNGTGSYRVADLGLSLPGLKLEGKEKVALAAGKSASIVVEAPLEGRDRITGEIIYRLSERAPKEGLLKAWKVEGGLQYTPWRLELVDPGYRQTIYATQKLTHLRARLHQTDPEADPGHLAAKLVSHDGKELPATLTPVDERTWNVEVAGIADLPDGRHRFIVTIGKGKEALSLEREITKLPYQKGETWIDALGVVRREGVALPFYGYSFGGWSGLTRDWLPGFSPTLAGPVSTWSDGEKRFTDQLKTVAHLDSLGIYSLLDVATATKAWRKGGESRKTYLLSPLGESEKQEYLASIERMKGNPSIIAYYLADEPELHSHTPYRLGQVSDLYRRNDPYKPVLVLNNTYHGLVDYLPTCDISMPDRYPVFRKGGGSSSSIAAIETHLKAIPVGSDSYQARWATLQACDYEQYNLADGRPPTAREMRSQQVSALIGGVSGITWYTQTRVYDQPGVLASLPYLEKEFRWVFESRQAALPRPLADAGELQGAILEGASGPMLLVVNPHWKQVTASLKDPLLETTRDWKRVGEEGTVAVQKGALSFRLEPHEAVILIPPSRAGEVAHLDWSAVEREEARIVQESRVRGNIAHRETGTVATGIPETANTRYAAFAAIDGMKSPKAGGYQYRRFQPGNGLELRFPAPKPLRRVVVHGTNITKGHLEVQPDPAEPTWEKVASFEHDPSRPELELALSGRNVAGLRLIGEAVSGRFTILKIIEVEAYE